MKLHLEALRYGSHRVAPANYTIPASTLRTFASWCHLNGMTDFWFQLATHLSTPEGWKASWLTYIGRYTHISGHTSAADRAEARESSPFRDRRSNHWATQPTCTPSAAISAPSTSEVPERPNAEITERYQRVPLQSKMSDWPLSSEQVHWGQHRWSIELGVRTFSET